MAFLEKNFLTNYWFEIISLSKKVIFMIGMIKTLLGKKDYMVEEDQLRELMKKDKSTQLIDVRTSAEYRMEHINPCQNISLQEKGFEDKIKYMDKDAIYILYCQSGPRSKRARKKMLKAGFNHVFVLHGGISKWSGNLKVK